MNNTMNNTIDLSKISNNRLQRDRVECFIDIKNCVDALSAFCVSYGGGNIQDRMEANCRFMRIIDKEILRRG